MIGSRFFDSSAWLSYLYANNQEIKSMVESNIILLTSAISIFEIKKKLEKEKTDINKINKSIEFIKNRSLIIDLNFEIAEKAVDLSIKNNLHTVDALIYSSTLINNSILITLDKDFINLDDTILIK